MQDSGVALSKEGYSLNWLGKSYARLLANENIRTRLIADSAHNQNPANASSQNLLIKGDNLEVLKHLMGAYSEQVKMIYIDPPYNTGSDGFVYQDDRKFSVEQLSSLAGIDEDEAKRILDFTSSSSNSHSAWLTFMYPRLYLAKQLLKEEGVIFIQIDDNEQAQLKVLCDEVFGEENFISAICVKMSHLSGVKMSHKDKRVPKIKEFILVYAKKINSVKLNPIYVEGAWDDVLDRYDYYVNQSNVDCKNWTVTNLNSHLKKLNLSTPKEINLFKLSNAKSIFRTATNSAFSNIEKNDFFEKVTTATGLEKYTYKGEEVLFASSKLQMIDGKVAPADLIGDIWTDIGINNLHNEGDVNFANGKKPLKLLARLINLVLGKKSSNDNEVILDFFAGSGTTAHAVMQLNAEDKGNRQFICVQIDEATDPKSEAYKAGYKTIFNITQARISKAAAKIQAEYPDCKADMGFKIFATQPMFDKYLDTPESLTENLELFDVKTLSKTDRHSLMLTWALRDGIKLGAPLTSVNLGGYTAYAAEKILYFVEPDISLSAVVALLEQLDNNPAFAPSRLVVMGYLLNSKTQREMSEAVKGYNNRKGIELTLDIRYN